MLLLVYHCKGSYGTEIYLTLESLFFLFNFQMVMNFSKKLEKTQLTSQKDVTIRIQDETAAYLKPYSLDSVKHQLSLSHHHKVMSSEDS